MCMMATGTINLHLRVSTSPFCLIFPNDGTLQQEEVTLHTRLQNLPTSCYAQVYYYLMVQATASSSKRHRYSVAIQKCWVQPGYQRALHMSEIV